MRSICFYILVCFISVSAFAQNSFTIKGRVIDSLSNPLESVTVFVTKVKDSTLVEYSFTDAKGNFDVKFKNQGEAISFKATMIGFEDYTKLYNNGIKEDIDLNTIVLKDLSTNLDELVIRAEVPPIRIKKDTLEFNASSFKVRPDANLEELLKQLPGIQIDDDKKITANGKEVKEILVNGKPFFSEDGKIALENLPSEIINKIQVTDKKSKKEKFTGELIRSDNASINITIDENKNKGVFGKISGGYGSDDRYESNLFLNSFNKRRKISVIGSANNINANSYSMNDVFDNMRAGKSGSGITESRLLGVNFVEDINDKLVVNGSYDYNFGETENWNKSSITRFLPTGEFASDSESSSKYGNEGHRGNISIDYIGEKDALYIMPSFNKNHTYSNSLSQESSFDEGGKLLNESNSKSYDIGDSNSFGNAVRYTRKFKKEGQFLSVDFSNSNSISTSNSLYESNTYFYQSEKEDDIRRQSINNKSISDSYNSSIEFSQPITDSLVIKVGTRWEYSQNIDDKDVYDYDEVTGMYSIINHLQTNKYITTVKETSPYVGISIMKEKFSLSLESATIIAKNSAYALFNQKEYNIDKYYIDPRVSTFFNYNLSKGKNLTVIYTYLVNYQSASQLLDITDISNPLNTTIGNPDLKPTGQHSMNVYYRSYDVQSRTGYSLSSDLSLFKNNIVNYTQYDEDRKSISTYRNVSGDYRWGLSGEWYKTGKWEEHSLRFGIRMRYNQSFSKGYIDGTKFDATSNALTPNIYLSYDYGEFLTIRPSYSYNYNWTTYSNFSVDKASYYGHNVGLKIISYWPKNLVIGNDFAYNYNSRMAKSFKRDFYMWNLSASYDFFKNKFTAKVKVYDVLNQNTSARHTIDPMQIVDSESLVLKRYVMFSLTYKLNEFGGKKGRNKGGNYGSRPTRIRVM